MRPCGAFSRPRLTLHSRSLTLTAVLVVAPLQAGHTSTKAHSSAAIAVRPLTQPVSAGGTRWSSPDRPIRPMLAPVLGHQRLRCAVPARPAGGAGRGRRCWASPGSRSEGPARIRRWSRASQHPPVQATLAYAGHAGHGPRRAGGRAGWACGRPRQAQRGAPGRLLELDADGEPQRPLRRCRWRRCRWRSAATWCGCSAAIRGCRAWPRCCGSIPAQRADGAAARWPSVSSCATNPLRKLLPGRRQGRRVGAAERHDRARHRGRPHRRPQRAAGGPRLGPGRRRRPAVGAGRERRSTGSTRTCPRRSVSGSA